MNKDKKIYAALGLIVIFEIALYATHGKVFVLDDTASITRNTKIQGSLSQALSSNPFRSVTMASYWINVQTGGFDAWCFHLVNLFFHTLTGLAIFFLIKEYSDDEDDLIAPLIGAGWFILNPFTNFAAVYISTRATIFATFFTIVALIFYKRFSRSSDIKYLLAALILSLFAMFSKENGLVSLGLILFLSATGAKRNKKEFVAVALCLIVAAIYLISRFQIRVFLGVQSERPTPYLYFLTQMTVIPQYVLKTMLPSNFALYMNVVKRTSLDLTTLLCGLGMGALWSAAVYRFRKSGHIVFFLIWLPATLALESSVLPFSDYAFSHRAYMPAVGAAALIGFGLRELINIMNDKTKKNIIFALIGVIFIFYGMAGFKASAPWNTLVDVYRQSVRVSPNKYQARHDLGYALNHDDKDRAAITHLEVALRIGGPLGIDTAQTFKLLGKSRYKLGDYYGALECFAKASELDPRLNDPYIKIMLNEAMKKARENTNGANGNNPVRQNTQ